MPFKSKRKSKQICLKGVYWPLTQKNKVHSTDDGRQSAPHHTATTNIYVTSARAARAQQTDFHNAHVVLRGEHFSNSHLKRVHAEQRYAKSTNVQRS